ncbi:hypothetical protein COO60DRAFT_1625111 [Scenedesmus sp. NREL 46B-D3]|nr:hypothetical protein COO60DRAFT_1625111 [Scenedesmus sp. NREL 46B-D3]
MADVKDILGVPRATQGDAAATPAQKAKPERMKRPEGMSREAFALLGGSNPVIPSHLLDGLKKKDKLAKPKASTKGTVIYRYKQFKNQARDDGLELRHWVKGYKDANGRIRDAQEGDYAFAKYNKKVTLYRYDGEEWLNIISRDNALAAMGWTKEETDYLLDMLEAYDLRFVVVADRYNFPNGPPRTLEDLKDRYYAIARRLLIAREGTEATLLNNQLLRQPYNANAERARRAALTTLMARSNAAEASENEILEQARVVEEKRKAEHAAAAQAAAAAAAAAKKNAVPAAPKPPPPAAAEVPFNPGDLIFPQDFHNAPMQMGMPSLLNAHLEAFWPQPGVYARGVHTRETAAAQEKQALGSSQKNQKALEAAVAEIGYAGLPRYHSRAVSGAYLALRGETLALLELRRQYQARTDTKGGGGKRKKGDDGGRVEKRQRTAKRPYD